MKKKCYYSCYLDRLSYSWICTKINNITEVNNYTYFYTNNALITKIVIIDCFDYFDYINKLLLYKNLQFPIQEK